MFFFFSSVWMKSQFVYANPQNITLQSDEAGDAVQIVSPADVMRDAWQVGKDQGKPVMLVLGSEACDRCALLNRYLDDSEIYERVSNQFVILSVNVAMGKATLKARRLLEESFPAIVLMDIEQSFDALVDTDQLVTFSPEPQMPIFTWLEYILEYTHSPS